jgi:hypothetical protein
MVDAYEVIEVPDYSHYPHEQTVETRADQLVPGDELIIAERPLVHGRPDISGQVYQVSQSYATTAHGGPGWLLLAFGADMVRFRVEPHEIFHKRVTGHDAQTCGHCRWRWESAKTAAASTARWTARMATYAENL